MAGLRSRLAEISQAVSSSKQQALLQECIHIAKSAFTELDELAKQPLPESLRLRNPLSEPPIQEGADLSEIGIKALRLALDESKHTEHDLKAELDALKEQVDAEQRQANNREIIMKSMAAQLEIRDQRIRALEASVASPEALRDSIEIRTLEESLLTLQEQVVELSEELEAIRQAYEN
ncbi:MAG: hypothetical protein IPJ88_12805 [Myxococcales bacterium]|nr:MAG: hypothetical protein IPJ88_12805 [Myxococcales bacterium]